MPSLHEPERFVPEPVYLQLPGSIPIKIDVWGTEILFNVWYVHTVVGLQSKVSQLVYHGLWDDFCWIVSIKTKRGLIVADVKRVLLFAMPNAIWWQDIRVEIPKQ